LSEHLLNNIYFDTCVYHQPGIDLLNTVIPVKNVLFASEMIGAVRGIGPRDRQLLRRHQAATSRRRRSSAARTSSRSTKAMRGGCFPRLDSLV